MRRSGLGETPSKQGVCESEVEGGRDRDPLTISTFFTGEHVASRPFWPSILFSDFTVFSTHGWRGSWRSYVLLCR